MLRLLEGLKVIHSLGVVHRDIKPANILLNPHTLEVRYIDFGLACTKDDLRCQGEMVGTMRFISPEILETFSKVETPSWEMLKKADVWALGLTFLDLCFPDVASSFYNPDKQIFTEIARVKPASRLMELAPHDKTLPLGEKKMFFVQLVSLMMLFSYEKRPSARIMLELVRTSLINELLQIAHATDLKEIEERALIQSKRVVVNPRTKIFPGKTDFLGKGNKKGEKKEKEKHSF